MPRRSVDEWFWTVDDLQRLQAELVRTRPAVATGTCWEPRVDIIEDDRRIIIKAELAGARGEDVRVHYISDRNTLVIHGHTADEDGPGRGRRFHQMEIPSGQFAREVKLPDVHLDLQNMRAQYRNGFLYVMIPRAEHVVVAQITISGS